MVSACVYSSARVVHVLFGVFWAGSVFFAALFLDPSVREAGPEGGQVMGILQRRGWMNVALTVAALTIATGIWLLWVVSGHFSPAFMGSRRGILLGIGMLAAFITFGIGLFLSRPTSARIGALASRLAAAGAPPAAEDLLELARLRGRMTTYLRVVAALLLVATLTMAWGSHG